MILFKDKYWNPAKNTSGRPFSAAIVNKRSVSYNHKVSNNNEEVASNNYQANTTFQKNRPSTGSKR